MGSGSKGEGERGRERGGGGGGEGARNTSPDKTGNKANQCLHNILSTSGL